MKRLLIMLTMAIFVISCEKDILEDSATYQPKTKKADDPILTRTVSSEIDFDPLLELSDNKVPVNIINVGNTKYKYLSCKSSGKTVYLRSKDPGDELGSWYLRFINLGTIVFNIARETNTQTYSIEPEDEFSSTSTNAILRAHDIHYVGTNTGVFARIPNTNNYRIVHTFRDPYDSFQNKSVWLQCENSTSTTIKYKNKSATTMAYWKVVPVGEYEIVDIKYIQSAEDVSIPKQRLGGVRFLDNPSAAAISSEVNFAEKITVSSTIREPEAIELSTTGQVSEPEYDTNGNLYSSSTGTVSNMEFGSTYSTEKTIGDKLNISVPPYSSVYVKATRYMYDVSATYIATVQSKLYGIRFRIKGKYTGSIFTHVIVRVTDANSGKLIETKLISKEI